MTKESMREAWNARGMNIDKDCLCNDCPSMLGCPWAWNLYNFGDCCLGDK